MNLFLFPLFCVMAEVMASQANANCRFQSDTDCDGHDVGGLTNKTSFLSEQLCCILCSKNPQVHIALLAARLFCCNTVRYFWFSYPKILSNTPQTSIKLCTCLMYTVQSIGVHTRPIWRRENVFLFDEECMSESDPPEQPRQVLSAWGQVVPPAPSSSAMPVLFLPMPPGSTAPYL